MTKLNMDLHVYIDVLAGLSLDLSKKNTTESGEKNGAFLKPHLLPQKASRLLLQNRCIGAPKSRAYAD